LSKRKTTLVLLLLTLAALAVHGYHPYAEDAEIYLPGVEKLLRPALFPVGTEFFESHAGLTFFPNLVAASIRITHLPFRYVLFVGEVLSIFLFLVACWEFTGICFATSRARWGGVVLIASLLTLPLAGTALYLIDQYLNPRNLAAFAGVFAVCRVLEKKYARSVLWLVFAAAVHPLMASFAAALSVVLLLFDKAKPALVTACLLPFENLLAPPSDAYRQAVNFHIALVLRGWHWYEWLGLVAPLGVLIWFAGIARARHLRTLERICRALVLYELLYFAVALVVAVPERFETLSRLQPLRSLDLLYIFMLIAMGGFVAEQLLKDRVWRWVFFFLPLCAGMCVVQLELFPASAHIEWPWAAPKNPWAQAFVWIRSHTPEDAIFALDPYYMHLPGEDTIGFRALAERSRLADAMKDSGAVVMFPPLAEQWWEQLEAQKNWNQFTPADFLRLQQKYAVNWVVLESPGITGFDCLYRNRSVAVCRIGA
jgi:hypothetical protein